MATRQPVKVALLGAGGFALDAHCPALKSLREEFLVTTCWSRSEHSAGAAAQAIQEFSPSCRPCHGDGGLQDLLASPELEAVIIVLPPQAQGAVIQAALRAGKHVLSEKPAAPTLAQAEQLLAFHRSLPQPAPLWCVGENYRSMPAFLRLREAVRGGAAGALLRLEVAADLALAPGNKYYESAWRRDSATMPGAYLTEGGVHWVAALRLAAAAAGWGEAAAAAATARGVAEDLPHPDTLQGMVWFENGAVASYAMTTAAGVMHVALRAVGTQGTVEAERGGAAGAGRAFRLTVHAPGQAAPEQEQPDGDGVRGELLSFARLVRAAAAAPAGASLTLTAREAGAAAATDGSDPEPDAVGAVPAGAAAGPGPAAAAAEPAAPLRGEAGAGGAAGGPGEAPAGEPAVVEGPGKARIKDLPSDEDAWRVSCLEAARDLAVVAALLQSAEGGGQRVPVAQF